MPGRLIAHQIHKVQHSRDAQPTCREHLLPTEGPLAAEFIQELRTAISSRNPVAGRFARPAGAKPPFEQRLLSYLADITDAQFLSFTRDAIGLLIARMQTEPLAVGGYVVFAEYEHGNEPALLIAVLSKKAHPNFDAQLNLIASESLDFEHLRYAARIRFNGMPTNEDGVVHFVSRRTEGVSDYFREFLGCEPVTDSAAQGRQLFSALRGYAESQAMNPQDREAMMQRTYSYWQDCKRNGRPMEMTTLSNLLRPDDPRIVLRHFEMSAGLAGEFQVPPYSVMKQFKKFAFDRRGLKLEFDRDSWLDNVSVRNGSVTIRNAPTELITQIAEEKGGNS